MEHARQGETPERGGLNGKAVAIAVLATVILLSLLTYRVQTSQRTLPQDRLLVSDGWADESVCADCHEQGETFWDTGHAQTLRRVAEETSKSLLETLNDIPRVRDEGTTVSIGGDEYLCVHQQNGARSQAFLGWCFGSGHHAMTWVDTLADSRGATELLEFRWTWYKSVGTFDVTPGQPEGVASGYFGGLGVLFDHPKARRCFGCHSSHVPLDGGRILEDEIKPGVTCQRCHGPRAAHVASEGEIHDPFWSNVTQMESINRCAECHRRAEEHDAAEITTESMEIVRFQPIGLTQSPCFLGSEMTCVTCHDPHRPLEAQDSTGIWQCIQCHDGMSEDHPLCGSGHADDCLRCHMPKIDMEQPLQFTDHWIRVRDDVGAAP